MTRHPTSCRSCVPGALRALGLAALLAACACSGLQAQQLSLLGGTMETTDPTYSSYSWQVDYRQHITRNWAASVAYINEGHVPGHHRDGMALEGWGQLPLWQNRAALSLGAGLYHYFDTQILPPDGSADVHGTAPILSLAFTGRLRSRWFYQMMVNSIRPAHEMRVNTAVLGVGYWFGPDPKRALVEPGEAERAPDSTPRSEFTVFGGRSVVNTFLSQSATACALEYRRGLTPYLAWTASLIHEGDPEIVRRDGLAAQVWAINTFFHDHVDVGIGLGPYVFIDRKHPTGKSWNGGAMVAPMVSLEATRWLSETWSVRVLFHRVASNYNRDSDIFLLGVGYRCPGRQHP